MTEARPRGVYAKTEAFRARVLDAALSIVAEQGFDGATLQRIAESVGRSKAGLLHHFGSRERLLLEIVRHRDRTNGLAFPPDADGGLDSAVDLVAHNTTVPGLVALFTVVSALGAGEQPGTESHRFLAERYAHARADYTRRIARAQEEGALRDDIAAPAAASIVLAAMDGLQTQWLLDPAIDMAEHLRALVGLLGPRG
jgi:AcrR family transcriptional regulator